MKITRNQLIKIIREAIDTQKDIDKEFSKTLQTDLEAAPPRSFRIPYQGQGYGGRRIVSRDRSWLEFVPSGEGPITPKDMFRSVTLLKPDDPEISKALKGGAPKHMRSIEEYDVYYVYATTTG